MSVSGGGHRKTIPRFSNLGSEMMKLSIICCVLAGFLIAVPLSNRAPIRLLSVNESSSVHGAQLGGFYPWTKCGITRECKRNNCSVNNCSGWKTTPIANAPSEGCNDFDWFSVCVEETVLNILQQRQPCATKGGACSPRTGMVNGVLVVVGCDEDIGIGDSNYVTTPTAPISCASQSLVDLLLPL